MHQNAVYFASKRSAICTKTQDKMQQTRGKMQQNAAKTHKKHHFKRYL